MTFTAPKKYDGPVVQGWEPGKNRNMSIYIKPNENIVINDISCMMLKGL